MGIIVKYNMNKLVPIPSLSSLMKQEKRNLSNISGNQAAVDLLFYYINEGNISSIHSLINKKEADLNCFNINGQTPLHTAVESNNLNIVELLIKSGAQINIADNTSIGKNTILHSAINNQNYKIVKCLIDNNADVNKTN